MSTNKFLTIPILAATALAGMTMGLSFMANAQTPTATIATSPTLTTSTAPTMPQHMMGHAPLGNDGTVTAVNGTSITMTEEANEGGAAYTVDATGATIMKAGAAGQLSDIKVGDTIFVTGTVNGTKVTATAISDGMGGHGFGGHAPLGNDGNITAINGTTITMSEEADEGGASYTVNAAGAAVTNNGAAAQLSDLKVGDKIFVNGTVSGTNVTATQISTGMGGHGFGGHGFGPR